MSLTGGVLTAVPALPRTAEAAVRALLRAGDTAVLSLARRRTADDHPARPRAGGGPARAVQAACTTRTTPACSNAPWTPSGSGSTSCSAPPRPPPRAARSASSSSSWPSWPSWAPCGGASAPRAAAPPPPPCSSTTAPAAPPNTAPPPRRTPPRATGTRPSRNACAPSSAPWRNAPCSTPAPAAPPTRRPPKPAAPSPPTRTDCAPPPATSTTSRTAADRRPKQTYRRLADLDTDLERTKPALASSSRRHREHGPQHPPGSRRMTTEATLPLHLGLAHRPPGVDPRARRRARRRCSSWRRPSRSP